MTAALRVQSGSYRRKNENIRNHSHEEEVAMFVPVEILVFFGFLAVLRELYAVIFKRRFENLGEFAAITFTFAVYLTAYLPVRFSLPCWIGYGVLLIFIDKSIFFAVEIWKDRVAIKSLIAKVKGIVYGWPNP